MRPNPSGDVLARRILQAFNLIQVVVVECLLEWCKRRLNFRKIHDPASRFRDCSFHENRDMELVAVQSSTFVSRRDVREAVGSFEREFPEDFQNLPLRAVEYATGAIVIEERCHRTVANALCL